MTNNIILNPEPSWMLRINIGHIVWLVKEKKEAIVKIKPSGFRRASFWDSNARYMGHIGLCIDDRDVNWHVSIDGKGFDDSLLMLPIENNILTIEEYEYKIDLEFCNKYNISVIEFRSFKNSLKDEYLNVNVAAQILIEMQHQDYVELIPFFLSEEIVKNVRKFNK